MSVFLDNDKLAEERARAQKYFESRSLTIREIRMLCHEMSEFLVYQMAVKVAKETKEDEE